jgi:hypothetical protein
LSVIAHTAVLSRRRRRGRRRMRRRRRRMRMRRRSRSRRRRRRRSRRRWRRRSRRIFNAVQVLVLNNLPALRQLRRLRTWWGHPPGMNTASPSRWMNDHGRTPVSWRSASRSAVVR